MKQDYYELLGLEADASDLAIKKAYRKRALQLHPDKNPDNIEDATKLFNEVRLAYETLKDPQERSWYDSHKFQVLMEDSDRGSRYEEEQSDEVYYAGTSLYDIQSYINPALYQCFDDSINGFYAVVSVLLSKLASEEVSAGKAQKLNDYNNFKDDTQFATACDPRELLYPRMGNSKTAFEQTKMFYRIWGSFQSIKTFSWCDEYRYSSAPDRRTRRLMEKENKKLRDQARKEYNECVRKLITFIKKVDPRMDPAARKKFEKEKQNKRMEELKRQAEIDKKNRREQRDQYMEQDWQTFDPDDLAEIEEELARIHEEEVKLNSNDENGDDNYYECIICNKTFKSEKQLQDHERSKKHLKLLKQLQWEMKREGIELGLDEEKFVHLDEQGDIFSDDENFEDALEDLNSLGSNDDYMSQLEDFEIDYDKAGNLTEETMPKINLKKHCRSKEYERQNSDPEVNEYSDEESFSEDVSLIEKQTQKILLEEYYNIKNSERQRDDLEIDNQFSDDFTKKHEDFEIEYDEAGKLTEETVQKFTSSEYYISNEHGLQKNELEVDDTFDDDVEILNREHKSAQSNDNNRTKANTKMTREEMELAELNKAFNNANLNDSSDDEWASTKSKLKSKKKRKKQNKDSNLTPEPSNAKPVEHCSVCSESFTSRNKLFQHVSATGHAVATKKSQKGKKGKRK